MTIFDELARQDREAAVATAEAGGPLVAYRYRYRHGQLIPGESCPACGHVFPGRYDGSQNHHLMTDAICIGMDLTRNHLSHALRDGADLDQCRERALRAGWSVAQVDAWIADPTTIFDALEAMS
ncbi:hypothetical protein [Brachybacterium sp.]|uniref:hypothetical protein n=1 Tax=Brachybacterium sp. TaxID=1891286 RepID=UPI002ED14C77